MLSGLRLYRIVDNDLSSVGPEPHPAVAGLVNAAAARLGEGGQAAGISFAQASDFRPAAAGLGIAYKINDLLH